ncbi:MAG: heavy-metal-associated domain-containing protein [Planctomycetota bacterium]
MATRTFAVSKIRCNHCVMTIERELGELKGVTSVKADADSKKVVVEWQEPSVTVEIIRSKLVEINFPPDAE